MYCKFTEGVVPMNNNNFSGFKFLSLLYLKLKNKSVNSLDIKIQALKHEIDCKEKLISENKNTVARLMAENSTIKKDYSRQYNLFENFNKTITIRNNNCAVASWENLYIKKRFSEYVLQTKKGEDVYVFQKDMTDFLNFFLTLNYSIIVLSVDKNRIMVQFRLL
jgi:hypothetical protein